MPDNHSQPKVFVYPMNFVPFLDPKSNQHHEWWGANPGHGSLRPDRWHGRLTVVGTVVSPVLLPDPNTMRMQGDHGIYGIAAVGGIPVINPTAIKGPLRALYEAATNSRVGVWSSDSARPLTYRSPHKPYPRVSYDRSPTDLVPKAIRRASRLNQLSAADQVFGWVPDEGTGGYAGHLRIRTVTVEDTTIDQCRIPDGPLTLAELSSPKPPSLRIYAAADPGGGRLKAGTGKDRGYKGGQGLRGRKMYLYQPPLTPEGKLRDAVTSTERNERNRSVTHWIPSGTTLRLDLAFSNLTSAQLGALIWCVDEVRERFEEREKPRTTAGLGRLRIGHGKPFGFGMLNLKIDWESSRLVTPSAAEEVSGSGAPGALADPVDAWPVERLYSTLEHPPPTTGEHSARALLIAAYHEALAKATGGKAEVLHYALTRMFVERGAEAEVRYTPGEPGERGYDWFVKNEGTGKVSMPAVAYDASLLITSPAGRGGGGGRSRNRN